MKKIFTYPTLAVFALALGLGVGYLVARLSGIDASLTPVISAALGLLVAFSSPLWQVFFVNAPKLSVEINAVKREVTDAAVVFIDDDPELRALKPTRELPPFWFSDEDTANIHRSTISKRGHTLAQTEELLTNAKRTLRDLPAQIEERKKELDRVNMLTPKTLTAYECSRLNAPLMPEVKFDPENFEANLESFRSAYQKRADDVERRYADLQSNLPSLERRIEALKKELLSNRSYFTVSASLINSGKSNTAVKVPGLLRVSIGEGNYIDLKLMLRDFEEKSEISANGTRIVVFESSEISSLPEEDRKLINTYWGQSVSARLFIEDIHSDIYASNAIAFAEGLYQKIIYDRLARAASNGLKR